MIERLDGMPDGVVGHCGPTGQIPGPYVGQRATVARELSATLRCPPGDLPLPCQRRPVRRPLEAVVLVVVARLEPFTLVRERGPAVETAFRAVPRNAPAVVG